MPLLPHEMLHATLVVGGHPCALRSATLSVEILGHGFDPETMHAIASPHVELDVHARLVFDDHGDELRLLVKIPPAPLGMSLGGVEDEPSLQVHRLGERGHLTLTESTLQREADGRLQVRARGALADARTVDLSLRGWPTDVEVDVLAPDGARARALCLQALPQWREMDGVLTEETTDGVHALRWKHRLLAALEDAELEALRAPDLHDEQLQAERLAALRAQHIPQPTDALPLVAGRSACAVRDGSLQLRVDEDGLAHSLSLELMPDDARAGEDGSLCPSCSWSAVPWSIALPLEGQWQALELPQAEAWFGNDAPPLENNRLSWRLLSATTAEVVWSAEYEDHHTRQTERLEFNQGPGGLHANRVTLTPASNQSTRWWRWRRRAAWWGFRASP